MDECDGALLKDNKQSAGKAMEVEKRLSILDMFGSLKMAGRSITCWAIWFIGSLGYYVFSLGSVNLGGNQYINLFLAGNGDICYQEGVNGIILGGKNVIVYSPSCHSKPHFLYFSVEYKIINCWFTKNRECSF